MKKNIKNNIYYEYITYENIYKMWKIIKKTCKNKNEVYNFSLNLSTNLYKITNELKTKTYKPSKYNPFMIFEPKPRLVMSQKIKDKIVNHFITNYYLLPILDKSLIDSNVATRTNKGSSYVDKLLKKYLDSLLTQNKEIYCLKIDISKYFYTIDHEILINKIKKKIKDKNVINLIKIIINETNNDYINKEVKRYNTTYNLDTPYYINNKGLSIGAMTSQFLAIFYLNDLDHYIKEKLKMKYYIRYMDDLLILDTDKEKLKNVWKIINDELRKLKLKPNPKSNIYKCSNGFNFLGYKYKVINNKIKITNNKKTYKRINKKLKKLKKDKLKYKRVLASYKGYLKIKEVSFKVKLEEIYENYKIKNENFLIIVKDGLLYKTYGDDAKIMWYIFEYKYSNDEVVFGNNSLDKVIEKLRKINMSFLIVNKEGLLVVSSTKNDVYLTYKELAGDLYLLKEKENVLITKLKEIIETNNDKVDEIMNYFDKILGEK